MKNIKTLLLVVAAAALAGCQSIEVDLTSRHQGSLQLDITMQDAAATRAAMGSQELLSSARVGIYMADFSGLVRSFAYSEAPSVIYLPADSYRVDVIAGEAAKQAPATASWEQKSYKGSKEFDITAGGSTSVQVEAKVCNAVTRIGFDKTIAETFAAGYTLSIGLDADSQLVYDASKADQDGYFIVDGLDEPELAWTFSGKLSRDGSDFTKTGTIKGIEAGKLYKMTMKYTIKDGELVFELMVDYTTSVVDDTIIFEPLSTGLSASSRYEIWAGHATVHADVDESEHGDPSKVKFEYSADGSSWTTVDAVRGSEGSYEATIKGLTPATEYSYRLVIDGEVIGEPMTFTTEEAPEVPNGSFENISKASSNASYYVWYDPDCSDVASQTMWWGSGNGTADINGSASMGLTITKPDESTKVDGDRSVCLVSQSIIGMLAAGNLFSGKFMGLVGTSGGRVAFGRPWTARPTALKCWVKYSTSTINIIKSTPAGVSVSKSDYDRGMVRIALGTWNYRTYGGSKESPVLVNTTDEKTIIDFSKDPATIALGEHVIMGDASNSTNTWKEITIPIEYSDTNTYPTHIIISCASSYYGDYFTGSDSSKLWIDKMELIYE